MPALFGKVKKMWTALIVGITPWGLEWSRVRIMIEPRIKIPSIDVQCVV